ncbi:MAG TPA: hypothetical protein DCP63_12455 [Bacteroidetes bacterium]|nr:hypothetical protein [Bacteroidota bacterium]
MGAKQGRLKIEEGRLEKNYRKPRDVTDAAVKMAVNSSASLCNDNHSDPLISPLSNRISIQ